MSRTRIHNLAISLDGFATREPQSTEAPFGHAGQRLHDWMFGTRFWARQGAPGGAADAGGSAGVDHAFAERHGIGFGAEIMGANKFGPRAGRTIRTGRAGGGRHGVQRGRGVLGLGLLLRPHHRNRGAAPGLHPARRLDLAPHALTVDARPRRTQPVADPDGAVGTWLRSEPPV